MLLLPFLAFSAEKTGNDKELEQIFTLEREFYIEPFRNPAYDRTGKIEKAAAKFAKKKKDSDAKFRAKALLSAIYRSEEKFDKAVEIVADCADFDKISSNSAFPFKSSYLACFLELAHSFALQATKGSASGLGQVQAPAPSGSSASPNQNSGKLRSNFLEVQGLAPALEMLDYAERNTSGVSFATTQEDYDKALALPPYSPELNPVESLWDHARENACANTYFETLDNVIKEVNDELANLAKCCVTVAGMFCWP